MFGVRQGYRGDTVFFRTMCGVTAVKTSNTFVSNYLTRHTHFRPISAKEGLQLPSPWISREQSKKSATLVSDQSSSTFPACYYCRNRCFRFLVDPDWRSEERRVG